MISTIGIMIGCYIIFRLVEIACRAKASYASNTAHDVVVGMAIIGVLVAGFLMANLLFSSSGATSVLSGSGNTNPSVTTETCHDPHERLNSAGACFCESGYTQNATTLKCVKD
jgi:RsiW-degrading membrane proteinase PrsW (M82 family)